MKHRLPLSHLSLCGLLLLAASLASCHRHSHGCGPCHGSAYSGKAVVTESVRYVPSAPREVVVQAPTPRQVVYQPISRPAPGYQSHEYTLEKPIRYHGKPKFMQRLTNYSYLGVYPPHDYTQSRSNPFIWHDRSPAYDRPGMSYFSQNVPPWPNNAVESSYYELEK